MNINSSQFPGLREIFFQALKAVQGQVCVSEYLRRHPVENDVYLIAIGKAACSMAAGAQLMLGDTLKDSLVVTRYGYGEPVLPGIHVVEAGHPLPDDNSLEAGRQLLAFVQGVPAKATLLFLISGGASALVEVLPNGIGLADLQQLNQWLLQSGLQISQMNLIRKQVSCIKGGRLAQQLQGRHTIALLMSDVQGDDPAVIGSGLLFASQDRLSHQELKKLPDVIQGLLSQAPSLPSTDDPCFKSVKWQIIASLSQAMNAAVRAAKAQGYGVITHPDYLHGDAIACGQRLAQILQSQPNFLHVWGGETTIVLPPNPGIGGRCQSLALSTALTMRQYNNWCLLAAGTDGSDGVSTAAGVCISDNSLAKAEEKLSASVEQYLKSADAGTLFEASGDLIVTGPTGTNVNDLVLGYCKN